MTDPDAGTESLEDFARSLSYGERSDLSFKFLVRFAGTDVGDAVAAMLVEIGGLFDDGDPAALIDLAIRLQSEGYKSRSLDERYHYEEGPFSRPRRPLAESRVVLLTSSGHFATGDDPQPLGSQAMSQGEAEKRIGDFLKEPPTLSEVSTLSPADAIEVRHGGYDIRGSVADHNVSFPIDRLRELDADGIIGSLHQTAYSFVGACSQTRLIKHTAPEWVDRLMSTGSDIVLLVPV